MLDPNQKTIVTEATIEEIAGAIRAVAIFHEVTIDDVIGVLIGLGGYPSSTVLDCISERAHSKKPQPEPLPRRGQFRNLRNKR